MSLFNELKRRNVLRVAAGYIIVAWLIVQVVETIFPAFGFGDEAIRFVVVGAAVGFIPAVILAWVFEWTPQGIQRDDGELHQGPAVSAAAKRWDRIVMVILAVAVTFFIVENILDEGPIEIEPAIVVLPFEGRDLAPGSEYLPTAIAEGVYTSLARIPQLVVSAWPTVNRLAEEGLDAEEITDSLNAANSLQGILQVEGDQLRLTVTIVESDSGRTIWQDSFEGTTADLFDIQYEIVAAAVEHLKLGSTGELYNAPVANLEASRLTLQAWSVLNRVNMPNRITVAIDLLERALEIDPDYAPALLQLWAAIFYLQSDGGISPEEAEAEYHRIEERVFAIDHENGVLNIYKVWELLWNDQTPGHANHHLQVALRTGLNDPEVLRMLTALARRTGNVEAAVWIGERAVAIDPTCENCIWQTTENLFYAGRYEEAIEAKKSFQAFGGGGYANHAYMLISMGKLAAALELLEGKAARDVQGAPLKAMAYHALGDAGRFAENIAEIEQMGGPMAQSFLAEVYAFTGDIDRAFEALNKTIQQGGRLKRDLFLPHWENLRDDTRWTSLREELEMSEENLAMLDFSPVLKYEK